MSWRKRPNIIKTIKESIRAVFHIGIVNDEVREKLPPGVEQAERILTGDLNFY